MTYKGYEAVVGLEIHVELKTKEKAFCRCSAEYGGAPDSKCCPVCLGMPGALPVLNPEAVRLACLAGLALGCDIAEISRFDRKHYFYPDLPKGYQITQYYDPLCTHGEVQVVTDEGERTVRIERIHLEEDAGKLVYDGGELVLDHNRCGVPLIEIVTCPDMRGASEAMALVDTLRRTLLFAGVSDCKMNEGSLRCDVNVSVRRIGESELGARCEIKNINSINFIGRAVEGELKRQVDLILSGGEVVHETRRFSEETCTTERMRDKESALDYRYIREPDLPPILTCREYVDALRRELPRLPSERIAHLVSLGVKPQQAELICSEVGYAEYFDELEPLVRDVQSAANMFISEVIPRMNDGRPVSPSILAECCEMYLSGDVNIVSARRILALSAEEGLPPRRIAEKHGLFVLRDRDVLEHLVKEAAEACPDAVREIRRGKLTAKKVLVGYVMRASHGKAEPVVLGQIVDEYFN